MRSNLDEARDPGEWLNDVVARVAGVANRVQSYAYEFYRCEDGSLLEVRCVHGRGNYTLTPVDQAGRVLGAVVPGDNKPYFLHPLPGAPEPPKKRRLFGRKESK